MIYTTINSLVSPKKKLEIVCNARQDNIWRHAQIFIIIIKIIKDIDVMFIVVYHIY